MSACAGRELIDFDVPNGTMTEAGLRNNISVAIQYVEAWLRGNGAVAIFNLMEDAATAEISRAQIWQWIHNPDGKLDDGRKITHRAVCALWPTKRWPRSRPRLARRCLPKGVLPKRARYSTHSSPTMRLQSF